MIKNNIEQFILTSKIKDYENLDDKKKIIFFLLIFKDKSYKSVLIFSDDIQSSQNYIDISTKYKQLTPY